MATYYKEPTAHGKGRYIGTINKEDFPGKTTEEIKKIILERDRNMILARIDANEMMGFGYTS